MKVMVAPASGHTSGQALQAIAEVAQENLPAGFLVMSWEVWREERPKRVARLRDSSSLCFVFVYLLLRPSTKATSCLYPYCCPCRSVRVAFFVGGRRIEGNPALKMILGTMSNDIYMQIALYSR